MKAVHSRGVALVAVLWIVAALTVLVSGVVHAQRDEIRAAGASRANLSASASGQAAVQMVLQQMAGGGLKVERLMRVPVTYGGRQMQVEIIPMNGLVDLNQAPEPLLLALFAYGGANPDAARQLVAGVMARRNDATLGPRAKFEAPEDLLSVQGVNYDLYASIAGFVTTDSQGSGRVNPLAAPLDVLMFLARGDAALAGRIAADRDAGLTGIDTTRLETAFTDTGLGSRFRFRAIVPMGEDERVVVTRDIDASPDMALPWQVLRSSSQLVRGQPA